ncbi:TetR/AcrR family transcriptional regulator [Rhizobium sp. SGZ-381]|uniref:TetR/AcrR family transcriptional regulator n=1 Tax=Rhizobium sp. SGZ-381 TaxID=3342800 RepID=UPI0036718C71
MAIDGERKLNRAEQKALRPIQILDAAFEEFIAHGYGMTRVEDIAERIGVTKGTIYVYFPTKENLFSAMIAHIATPLEELLRGVGDLSGNCAERLEALLLMSYEKVLKNRHTRELIRLVVSEGSRFPEIIKRHQEELIDPLFNHVQALLDEGIAAGEFRAGPAALASVIVGPVIALVVDHLVFGETPQEECDAYIRAHLDLITRGLAVADQ